MLEQANPERLPDADDFPAFRLLPGDETRGCVIVCDHASNAMPPAYGTLGLSADELERHIAYDIGAAGVTERLSQMLGVPAVLSGFSRLMIDPNRGLDDPTLVMRLSDGTVVPGNAAAGAAEIAHRIAKLYEPYHAAITGTIDAAIAAGRPPALLSIHSFTESWKDRPRPWHATLLWDKDARLPEPMVAALKQEDSLVIGENVPYSGELKGDCMYRHGTLRGLAHALIEIRQDLIREPAGQQEWAERIARILDDLLTRAPLKDKLATIHHFGSHTDSPQSGQMAPSPA